MNLYTIAFKIIDLSIYFIFFHNFKLYGYFSKFQHFLIFPDQVLQ